MFRMCRLFLLGVAALVFISETVDQNTREEINFQSASSAGGENYGWRLREGTISTPDVGGPSPTGAIDPVYDYLHGTGPLQGNSVTGGYVYRGSDPTLQGKYIFGDFVSGNIWAFDYDGQTRSNFTRLNDRFAFDFGTLSNVSSFAEDASGNLYVLDYDGDIFRISSVPEPSILLLMVLGSLVTWGSLKRRSGWRTAMAASQESAVA